MKLDLVKHDILIRKKTIDDKKYSVVVTLDLNVQKNILHAFSYNICIIVILVVFVCCCFFFKYMKPKQTKTCTSVVNAVYSISMFPFIFSL